MKIQYVAAFFKFNIFIGDKMGLLCRTMTLFFFSSQTATFQSPTWSPSSSTKLDCMLTWLFSVVVPRGLGRGEAVFELGVGSLEVGHTPFLTLRTHGHLLPLWWRHVSGDPPRGSTFKTIWLCTWWKNLFNFLFCFFNYIIHVLILRMLFTHQEQLRIKVKTKWINDSRHKTSINKESSGGKKLWIALHSELHH